MGNYYMQIHAVNFESLQKYPDCANPIPLTAEILEAAGFELQFDGVFDLNKGDWAIRIQLPNVDVALRVAGLNWYDMETHFSYLHQLQNLYFILTGDELEISLIT
jgi:hypothetical protein